MKREKRVVASSDDGTGACSQDKSSAQSPLYDLLRIVAGVRDPLRAGVNPREQHQAAAQERKAVALAGEQKRTATAQERKAATQERKAVASAGEQKRTAAVPEGKGAGFMATPPEQTGAGRAPVEAASSFTGGSSVFTGAPTSLGCFPHPYYTQGSTGGGHISPNATTWGQGAAGSPMNPWTHPQSTEPPTWDNCLLSRDTGGLSAEEKDEHVIALKCLRKRLFPN